MKGIEIMEEKSMKSADVLYEGTQVGSIKLLDYFGSDERILEVARLSSGADHENATSEQDRNLINFLMEKEHFSVFEHCTFTFRVEAPIFVARQWMRHRTQSYIEKSLRYQELGGESFPFYVPTTDVEEDGKEDQSLAYQMMIDQMEDSFSTYRKLLEMLPKETARMVLPLSTMTEFYTTMNLRNLFHFLELRLSEHAQGEIRVFAEGMVELIRSTNDFNYTIDAFRAYRLN
jgi:thymidylate synthase (FAD)